MVCARWMRLAAAVATMASWDVMMTWSPVQAEAVHYEFVRRIDLTGSSSEATRMTCGIADASGGIYFSDNLDDQIYYIPNAINVANPRNDMVKVYDLQDPPCRIQSGSSWQGFAFDGQDVYVSSANLGSSVLMRIRRTGPTSWKCTDIRMPAGHFGGCTAVSPGRLVMPDNVTGNLHFVGVEGDVAVVEPGSPVTGPGSRAVQACADMAHGRIYVSMSDGGRTGGAALFTTNGTAAGTKLDRSNTPLVAMRPSTWAAATDQPLHYQNVSVDPAAGVLVVSQNPGSAGGPNGWALFSLDNLQANLTAFQFLKAGDNDPALSQLGNELETVYGSVFFTIQSESYLAACRSAPVEPSGAILIYAKKPGPAPKAESSVSASAGQAGPPSQPMPGGLQPLPGGMRGSAATPALAPLSAGFSRPTPAATLPILTPLGATPPQPTPAPIITQPGMPPDKLLFRDGTVVEGTILEFGVGTIRMQTRFGVYTFQQTDLQQVESPRLAAIAARAPVATATPAPTPMPVTTPTPAANVATPRPRPESPPDATPQPARQAAIARPRGASAPGQPKHTVVLNNGSSINCTILKRGVTWNLQLPNGSVISMPQKRIIEWREGKGPAQKP